MLVSPPRSHLPADLLDLGFGQVLDADEMVVRLADPDQFVELGLDAAPSRFWVFWIRNTIRKVMIVVPVLMTSCQVSEKPKNGPVTAHTTTITQQIDKCQRQAGGSRDVLAIVVNFFSKIMAAPA